LQLPCWQWLEQHWPSNMHCPPFGVQLAAPHLPAEHWFEQHWPDMKHG
jgi:hypothetical protein